MVPNINWTIDWESFMIEADDCKISFLKKKKKRLLNNSLLYMCLCSIYLFLVSRVSHKIKIYTHALQVTMSSPQLRIASKFHSVINACPRTFPTGLYKHSRKKDPHGVFEEVSQPICVLFCQKIWITKTTWRKIFHYKWKSAPLVIKLFNSMLMVLRIFSKVFLW